jgi:endonuclease YncB( thermonuclease family)
LVRLVRLLPRLILALVFVAVAYYGVSDVLLDGCDTELCCEDCDELSVSRVIDGDTFVSNGGRIRNYGIDAPEVGRRCAGEATARLRGLAGDTVRVEPGPRSRDSFGRLLYYVYTESGESIDETLIREGLAVAWTRDGQHRDYLVVLETQARQDGSGCLW